MKTNTSHPSKKNIKKTFNKQLQKSLKTKFLDAVLTLGYNAAVIAGDIKKLSKVAAKKIAKQLKSTKKLDKKQIKKAQKAILESNVLANNDVLKHTSPTLASISVEPVTPIEKNERVEIEKTNEKQAIKAIPNNPVKKVKTTAQVKKSK